MVLANNLQAAAQSNDDSVTTLKSVLNETLRTNPDIKADMSASETADYQIYQAYSGYFPTVDVSGGVGREYDKQNLKQNPFESAVKGKLNQRASNPAFAVKQVLFNGFKTVSDVELAESYKSQADKKVDETAENTAYQAASAYIDVRRFQRLHRLSLENVQAHRDIAKKVNIRVDAGRAPGGDKFLIEARLEDAESSVLEITGELDAAIANYYSIVGIMPKQLGSSKIPEQYLPPTVETAIKVGRDKNRSVELAKTKILSARAQIDEAKSPFYPAISLEVNGSRQKNTSGRTGVATDITSMAVMRYNLLNGGADVSTYLQRAEQLTEQRFRLESARRSSEKDIRTAWANMVSAKARGKNIEISVKDKLKVNGVFAQQYNIGTRSLFDVVDALNDYFLTKGSLITINATEDLSAIKLLSSMGMLLSSFELRSEPENIRGDNDEDKEDVPLMQVKYAPQEKNLVSSAGITDAPIMEIKDISDETEAPSAAETDTDTDEANESNKNEDPIPDNSNSSEEIKPQEMGTIY